MKKVTELTSLTIAIKSSITEDRKGQVMSQMIQENPGKDIVVQQLCKTEAQ